MNEPRPSIVFSIGHGARPFPDVAADLERHGVDLIVDVRSAPYSRHNPDFIRRNLEEMAAEHGVKYRWLGDRLGGKPDDPDLLRNGTPDWEAVAATAGFAAGIDELRGIVAATTAAVLCAEGDPAHCHRALLVAPVLETHGIRMRHILPDGSVIDHQPPLRFPPVDP